MRPAASRPLLVVEAQMEQMQGLKVLVGLVRLFKKGVICPAEFWQAVESVVAPGELDQVFGGLDPSDQKVLRDLFHERPLSLRAMENRAFRVQLRKWVISGQVRTPPE